MARRYATPEIRCKMNNVECLFHVKIRFQTAPLSLVYISVSYTFLLTLLCGLLTESYSLLFCINLVFIDSSSSRQSLNAYPHIKEV